jgi:hypothetical protein
MGPIDDFHFEVDAVITKVLWHFAEEQVSEAYSLKEADFAADYIEQFATVYLVPLWGWSRNSRITFCSSS